jgi:hypothetical protein
VIKSKGVRWIGHVTCIGLRRNVHKILIGKQKLSPPGKIRHRWEDNIKMDLIEIRCGLDPCDSRWGPVAGTYEHGNEHSASRQEISDQMSDQEPNKECRQNHSHGGAE